MSLPFYILFMAACLVGFGDFFVSVFEKREIQISKGLHTLLYAACVLCILGNNILFVQFMLPRQVIALLIMYIYYWILYRDKTWKLLLWALLFHAAATLAEFFSVVVFQWLIPDIVALNSGSGDTWSKWLLAIFSQLVLFLIIVILKRVFGKQKDIQLSLSEWIRFLVFPIFSIVILSAIFMRFEVIQQEKMENVYLLVSFGLLFMNILVYTLIHDISKREQQIQQNQLFQERMQNEMNMYHSISEYYDEQRRREHEYKNQLTCISKLAKDRQYEEMSRYLQEINQSFMSQENVIDTNHAIINAILNSKYKEARDKGIYMTFLLDNLSQISIADEDLVVILSNLLNNAIEACADCEEKIIKVKIGKEEEGYLISVSNTYNNPPIRLGDKFQTRKANSARNHGIGIENIKAAVAKYDGNCVIQYDEKEFKFIIQL